MELLLLATIVFVLFIVCTFVPFHSFRKSDMPLFYIIFEYACSLILLFSFGITVLAAFGNDYYEEIDPIDNSYTAFATKHFLTLFVFWVLSLISLLVVWIRGRKVPPLVLVLSLVFILIGVGISVASIIQLSENTEAHYKGPSFGIAGPVVYIIVSLALIIKLIRQEADYAEGRILNNKYLEKLNRLMATSSYLPFWVVGLIAPVFVLITLILLLFGQEPDSIVKAFTETTTWRLSEMEHPPYLDHKGHYLCTVAACGHPSLVKPLRYGNRHGYTIVVNRQLLVANAFEECLMELSPKLHRFIRHNYDKYGYPFSRHISTAFKSDIIYLLMKPFEYLFIVCLYLLDLNPEARIARQYK